METIRKDVRYAIRNLLNARGFTIIAIITLALGIGANTAMFSVVNAVLLRPLPFHDPQQLMALGEYDTERGPSSTHLDSFSYPDFADVRDRNHSFQEISAYSENESTATGLGQAVHVNVEMVSANLFHLLGAQPSLGRAFLPEEDGPGHRVLILS